MYLHIMKSLYIVSFSFNSLTRLNEFRRFPSQFWNNFHEIVDTLLSSHERLCYKYVLNKQTFKLYNICQWNFQGSRLIILATIGWELIEQSVKKHSPQLMWFQLSMNIQRSISMFAADVSICCFCNIRISTLTPRQIRCSRDTFSTSSIFSSWKIKPQWSVQRDVNDWANLQFIHFWKQLRIHKHKSGCINTYKYLSITWWPLMLSRWFFTILI